MQPLSIRPARWATLALCVTFFAASNSQADPCFTNLMAATLTGDTAAMRVEFEKGASLDCVDQNGRTPLHTAANSPVAYASMFLLRHGAFVDSRDPQGTTPLMCAAVRHSVANIYMLQRYGADFRAVDTSGQTALHWAVSVMADATQHTPQQRVETIKALVDLGADRNAVDHLGDTPLMSACSRKDAEAVRSLLAAGVDPNFVTPEGKVALGRAMSAQSLDVVRELIWKSVDVNQVLVSGTLPLHDAVRANNEDMIKLLLNAGADPNLTSPAGYSAVNVAEFDSNTAVLALLTTPVPPGGYKGAADLTKPVVIDPMVEQQFWDCVIYGRANELAGWIAKGANINGRTFQEKTPLILAIEGQKWEVMHVLLQHQPDLSLSDVNGTSPLIAAMAYGDEPLVRDLIRRGAGIDARSSTTGTTPLIAAIQLNSAYYAKLLLDLGADPNIGGPYGEEAIYFAVAADGSDFLTLLIKFGAQVNVASDRDGATPLIFAAATGRKDAVKILLKAGADANARTGAGDKAADLARWYGFKDIAKQLDKAAAGK